MKLFLDFLPIILFFATFKWGESHGEQAQALANQYLGGLVSGGVVGVKEAPILLATVVVILATLAQVLWLKLRGKKVDTMLWVSLGLVTVMGGATVWFHSEAFIKWKPSVLYWIMGLAFWVSQTFMGKNLLKSLMGEQIDVNDTIWRRLNLMWVAFFSFMGVLNIYVAYSYPTDIWVNFKLFGGMGLMLVFTVAQGVYLSRHMDPSPHPPKDQ